MLFVEEFRLTKHIRWQSGLNAAEEERDADATKADTAVERIPFGHLRALKQNVGELQGHHAEDGIVFAVSLVSDRNRHESRAPVTDEPFSTGIEDGLAADSLCRRKSINQYLTTRKGRSGSCVLFGGVSTY